MASAQSVWSSPVFYVMRHFHRFNQIEAMDFFPSFFHCPSRILISHFSPRVASLLLNLSILPMAKILLDINTFYLDDGKS